jgi:hypothetical protein
MRHLIVTLLLLLGTLCLFAQPYEGEWATKAGGVLEDVSKDIIVDAEGNYFVAGSFQGDAIFGRFILSGAGDRDVYVGKVSSEGNWLWVVSAGGSGVDRANSIKFNKDGDIVVTGMFDGKAKFGSKTIESTGKRDIFVAKLSKNGTWLWAKRAGGPGNDVATGVTVDEDNNIFITGSFVDSATFGATTIQSSGGNDLFVAKLDANGEWVWAKRAGGVSDSNATCISIDADKNLYIGGYFKGTAQFGTNSLNSMGGEDGFVARINHAGNWQWAKRCGGEKDDRISSIKIDSEKNIVVAGFFYDEASFGQYSVNSIGDKDLFVAKMNNSGSWKWASGAGGEKAVAVDAISIGADDSIYTAGYFSGSIYVGDALYNSEGAWDILLTKIDKNGNWVWGRKIGGTGNEYASAITTDGADNIVVTGSFQGVLRIGDKRLESSGSVDVFVAKLTTYVSADEFLLPSMTKISATNYPNPFNPQTTIQFNIPVATEVALTIYNAKGELINTINYNHLEAGSYNYMWNGNDFAGKSVSSGVYFYKIHAAGQTITNRMILLK